MEIAVLGDRLRHEERDRPPPFVVVGRRTRTLTTPQHARPPRFGHVLERHQLQQFAEPAGFGQLFEPLFVVAHVMKIDPRPTAMKPFWT
ncbi:MAG TPA: hypothetical protein VGN51_24120 [Acidimicrobiia bacterium]|jgi:hypothetical protein